MRLNCSSRRLHQLYPPAVCKGACLHSFDIIAIIISIFIDLTREIIITNTYIPFLMCKALFHVYNIYQLPYPLQHPITSILQMRKLKQRVFQQRAQGHTIKENNPIISHIYVILLPLNIASNIYLIALRLNLFTYLSFISLLVGISCLHHFLLVRGGGRS